MAAQVPELLRGSAPGLSQGMHAILTQLQSTCEQIFAEPLAALAASLQFDSVLALKCVSAPVCISLACHVSIQMYFKMLLALYFIIVIIFFYSHYFYNAFFLLLCIFYG